LRDDSLATMELCLSRTRDMPGTSPEVRKWGRYLIFDWIRLGKGNGRVQAYLAHDHWRDTDTNGGALMGKPMDQVKASAASNALHYVRQLISIYVFCYNMTDGKFTAHPNPATMGTDVRALKAKDDPLGQRIFDTITKSSEGSVDTVDYNFPKPGTTEPVPKQSFVTKVGNQGCGVGYYK
jgi:signal transduction histidine kinase